MPPTTWSGTVTPFGDEEATGNQRRRDWRPLPQVDQKNLTVAKYESFFVAFLYCGSTLILPGSSISHLMPPGSYVEEGNTLHI